MSSYYIDRHRGHTLDDRLIDLVRENPAIYDVNHENYRRNQVRLGIWHKIAKSLGAPSKFVQTKWKNIRYNYLQDLKQQQNGVSAVKRRRSTRDLSFLLPATNALHLKDLAKTPMGNNCSDNESNSYIYQPENNANCFEILMIEPSEDGSCAADDVSPPLTCFSEEDKKPLINNILPAEDASTTGIVAPSPEPSSFSISPSQSSQIAYSNGNGNIISRKSSYSSVVGQHHNKPLASSQQVMLQPLQSDPIEMYCLSLADALRAMSRAERERVKFEFANILKDAKYKDNS